VFASCCLRAAICCLISSTPAVSRAGARHYGHDRQQVCSLAGVRSAPALHAESICPAYCGRSLRDVVRPTIGAQRRLIVAVPERYEQRSNAQRAHVGERHRLRASGLFRRGEGRSETFDGRAQSWRAARTGCAMAAGRIRPMRCGRLADDQAGCGPGQGGRAAAPASSRNPARWPVCLWAVDLRMERRGETDLLRWLRAHCCLATALVFYAALMDSRDPCLRGRRAGHGAGNR
jgi:hypothetical protein